MNKKIKSDLSPNDPEIEIVNGKRKYDKIEELPIKKKQRTCSGESSPSEIIIVEDSDPQDIEADKKKQENNKELAISFNIKNKLHHDLENEGNVDFYPKYLPSKFAKDLFNELMLIEYEHSTITMYGKAIKLPRVQAWMSDLNVNASLYQKGKALPWSEKMLIAKNGIEELYKFQFNYVLINLYRDGSDYISYHSDGESIGEGKNIIAGISLGATRKFVMRHNSWKANSIAKKEFNMESGSLIMMVGDNTQKYWKHSVPKTTKISSPRINLTFRHS